MLFCVDMPKGKGGIVSSSKQDNPGNFAQDRENASEAERKSGEASCGGGCG
jgi:general stress protein YciG